MTMGLTKRQSDCLAAIRGYIAEHGCSPSYADLTAALGLRSKSDIHDLLKGLRERGYVQWTHRQYRSLRLTDPNDCRPVLRDDLRARLLAYCAKHGENPVDVIHDAVDLHLDVLADFDADDARTASPG